MHQNAPVPDKKIKIKILGTGHSSLPRPSPTGEGIPPAQTPPPSAPSALGVPVPFHLRLEHCLNIYRSAWLRLASQDVVVSDVTSLYIHFIHHNSVEKKKTENTAKKEAHKDTYMD